MEEEHENENENVLGILLERAEEYGKTTLELVKLKSVDKISDTISTVISRVIASVFFVMFFLLASVGLSLWLGDILDKTWLGFFIVAAFYAIIGAVLYFIMHNPVKKAFSNMIIKLVLK